MFEKIIYLLTGSLGFIIFLLMVFRLKKNQNTNIYFIMFIFLSSIRFLAYGLLDIFPSLLNYQKQIYFLHMVGIKNYLLIEDNN